MGQIQLNGSNGAARAPQRVDHIKWLRSKVIRDIVILAKRPDSSTSSELKQKQSILKTYNGIIRRMEANPDDGLEIKQLPLADSTLDRDSLKARLTAIIHMPEWDPSKPQTGFKMPNEHSKTKFLRSKK